MFAVSLIVLGRPGDHYDDEDNDEKSQWNWSIASLRLELSTTCPPHALSNMFCWICDDNVVSCKCDHEPRLHVPHKQESVEHWTRV